MELWKLSAREIASGLEARAFACREVVEAHVRRIEGTNRALNAVCTLAAESAFESAAECDRRLQRGERVRRLEGVPVLVKDNIVTAGIRTTWGSRVFERFIPGEDAVSVERVKHAGGIILGKTNTPEFTYEPNTANRLFGVTRNPWDPRCSVSGSSGGNAAALAAGMAPLAIGTDMGGSIRNPSAYCGTVGMRASPGRVPVYPAEFAWDTMIVHVQGPMGRTVADIGLMLAVLAGCDDRDPTSLPGPDADYGVAASTPVSFAGVRVAYSPTLGGIAPVSRQVETVTRQAVARLAALGCKVEEADPDVADLREIVFGLRAFGQIARLGPLAERYREIMGEDLVRQIEASSRVGVRTIADAERRRSACWQRVRAFFERFEFLVTPTTGITAFRLNQPFPSAVDGRPIADFTDLNLFDYLASVTGLPAISVPSGLAENGLPAGLQIVGRRLREDRVLALAAAFEAASPPLGWAPAAGAG